MTDMNNTRNRLVMITSVFLFSATTGYLIGREFAIRPLEDAMAEMTRLQPEAARLKATILEQNAKIIDLQSRLTEVQGRLETVYPAKDTYKILTNQSLNLADGRLTVALVGPPTYEGINININGKQYPAVSGDIFKISPDPSTACQVVIQSYNMFNVILHASCEPAKPR